MRSIPAPRTADLPERRAAFWRMTGPGAVLVGLSIGAGELVIWPLIAAEHGASMLWAAALGLFLQFWVNLEIGRWAVSTGESAYTGFARVWKAFAPILMLLLVAQFLLPAWARTAGLALKALVLGPEHPSPDWAWTALTFAGVVAVLFGPKRIYAAVERTVMLLVVFITLGLIFIAFRVGSASTLADMGRGLVNVGHIEPGFPVRKLFSAMVFAGAGGAANLFYAYYLRDKQIGMGARIAVLTNPFRGRTSVEDTGYRFPDTPENARRFRDWFRYVILDQTLYFWLLNALTMFLFVFGALAVLHAQGIVPQDGQFIWDEAAILADQMGPTGRNLFLLIAIATLFSTQLTLVDGVSRSLADILRTNFASARRTSYGAWYARIALGTVVLGILLTFIMERFGVTELGFVFNAAYMGGLMMAIYTPLLLWMNLRHLPRAARPRALNIVMMCIASLVYVGFAVYTLALELGILSS